LTKTQIWEDDYDKPEQNELRRETEQVYQDGQAVPIPSFYAELALSAVEQQILEQVDKLEFLLNKADKHWAYSTKAQETARMVYKLFNQQALLEREAK
jgi:hypothetical protein